MNAPERNLQVGAPNLAVIQIQMQMPTQVDSTSR